ncbi:MAG: transporter [Paenibacillaceae bacterium]|nr:transporter [Paenibacillaceae bacterium]
MEITEGTAERHVLELNGLTKRFGGLTAVDHITLRIGVGQLYGILGPNGAGKSTLIRMIAGLLEPDEGSVRLSGGSSRTGSGSGLRHIGLCPQELVIWEGLTVWEQLLFMAAMHNIPGAAARKRGEHLLNALGLAEKKKAIAGSLSGGMKRRLNIMLALMHDPQVVILDEPHAGLDPQSRLMVREFLKGLSGSKTVILTTHDMEEVEKTADRAAIMDRGKVLAEDTPERLIRSLFADDFVEASLADPGCFTGELQALLAQEFPMLAKQGGVIRVSGSSPYELAGQLKRRLQECGVAVQDIRIRKAGLEDVFISMTGRGLRE